MNLDTISKNNQPLISVITVSYNAASIIEETIKSVINQSYENFEYIIIDGGSTDGTVDIIKQYQEYITFWISEPDKGLYYAMNKGIMNAKGMWINFMNCGDHFSNETILCQIHKSLSKPEEFDVVYGNSIINVGEKKFILKSYPIQKMEYFLPFCHQCCFVRTELMKKTPFDVSFRFVADYNFFYFLYKSGHRFKSIDKVIAFYETQEGMTADNSAKCYEEKFRVNGIQNSRSQLFRYKIKQCILSRIPLYLKNKIRLYLYNRNPERYILIE